MAQRLEDWLNGEVKELQKLPVGELSNTFFFRDPLRPNYIDWEHFYSPADGTILYQKVVQPYNERMFNQVYVPSLDYTYYLIQIADEDVNVIAPFKHQMDLCAQNERFSLIRWGSQVDLVLPLDERFNFELVLDDAMHVNAGLDKLVKINLKDDDIKPSYRRGI